MSFFEWNAKYKLGVDEMDGEHKILIAKMNRTYELITAKAPLAQCLEALDDFMNYTAEHFRDEEKYMGAMSYPQLSMHRSLHQALVASLQGFRRDMAGGQLAGEKLFDFLARWLTGHILGVDMRYAKYVQEHAAAK